MTGKSRTGRAARRWGILLAALAIAPPLALALTTAAGGEALMEVFTATAQISAAGTAIAILHALAHTTTWLLSPPLAIAAAGLFITSAVARRRCRG